jgi:hypothetical protein
VIGLMQSASFCLLGIGLVTLGWSFLAFSRVAGMALVISGVITSLIAVTALEDYGIWRSAIAMASIAAVAIATMNIPWFRQDG